MSRYWITELRDASGHTFFATRLLAIDTDEGWQAAYRQTLHLAIARGLIADARCVVEIFSHLK